MAAQVISTEFRTPHNFAQDTDGGGIHDGVLSSLALPIFFCCLSSPLSAVLRLPPPSLCLPLPP